jgi:hypothetical protein
MREDSRKCSAILPDHVLKRITTAKMSKSRKKMTENCLSSAIKREKFLKLGNNLLGFKKNTGKQS